MCAGCAGDVSEEEDDEGKLFHMKLALLQILIDSVSHESTHKPTGKLAHTCKPTSDLS